MSSTPLDATVTPYLWVGSVRPSFPAKTRTDSLAAAMLPPAIAATLKILTLSVLPHSGNGDCYSDYFFLHSVFGLCLRLPGKKFRR